MSPPKSKLHNLLPRNILLGKHFKTPKVQAFGVFIWLLCAWINGVAAECPPLQIDETARVAYVFDGDTLRLHDRRRVRVLGINAPELAHDKQVEQPLGRLARNATNEFFPKNATIHLVYDHQRKDRYGRVLAHVYNSHQQSLAAMLLAKGLAFQVVVPPNVILTKCLGIQARHAQTNGLGVWGEQYWRPHPSKGLSKAGFMRVSGEVVRITENRDVWLELEGSLVIKIAAGDRQYFEHKNWRSWRGKKLQLRGWVVDRTNSYQRKNEFKPLQLQLRHPVMLERLSN